MSEKTIDMHCHTCNRLLQRWEKNGISVTNGRLLWQMKTWCPTCESWVKGVSSELSDMTALRQQLEKAQAKLRLMEHRAKRAEEDLTDLQDKEIQPVYIRALVETEAEVRFVSLREQLQAANEQTTMLASELAQCQSERDDYQKDFDRAVLEKHDAQTVANDWQIKTRQAEKREQEAIADREAFITLSNEFAEKAEAVGRKLLEANERITKLQQIADAASEWVAAIDARSAAAEDCLREKPYPDMGAVFMRVKAAEDALRTVLDKQEKDKKVNL